jgi:hypothetical protein
MAATITSAPEPVGTDTGEVTLKRHFTLWSAFSLAFAYISPIVATYVVTATGLRQLTRSAVAGQSGGDE